MPRLCAGSCGPGRNKREGVRAKANMETKSVADRAEEQPGREKMVLVIHGPNLNLLGQREPEIYGRTTLHEINNRLRILGRELGLEVETFQANGEGEIIDQIQAQRGHAKLIIINPAGYTAYGLAIRDALLAAAVPVIEVHLTNVYRREPIRRRSIIADIAHGRIMGFGAESYMLAIRAAAMLLTDDERGEAH
jgi:3-dehydroquinate dehydratase-2